MTCRECRELAVDLVRGEVYEPSRVHAALQHSRACTGCATELHLQRSLQVALRLLAVDTAVDPPAHLESTLRQAARERSRQQANKALLRRGAATAVSVAAVVTLAVVTSHLKSTRAVPLPVPSVASTVNVPSSPIVERAAMPPAVSSPGRTGPVPRTATRIRPAHRDTRAAMRPDLGETRMAEGFVPLGYGGDLGPVEGTGQIVRVELPIDTLISLGPPIAGQASFSTRTVQADIWVGHDGIARAVRLIGTTSPRR